MGVNSMWLFKNKDPYACNKYFSTDDEQDLYEENKRLEFIIHIVAISMTPKTIYGIITIISWI